MLQIDNSVMNFVPIVFSRQLQILLCLLKNVLGLTCSFNVKLMSLYYVWEE